MIRRPVRLRAVTVGLLASSAAAAGTPSRTAWQGAQLHVDTDAFHSFDLSNDKSGQPMQDREVHDSGSFLQADPFPPAASSGSKAGMVRSWLPHLMPSVGLPSIQWVEKIPLQLLVVPVMLGFAVLLLTLCSCFDFQGKIRGQEQPAVGRHNEPLTWSILGIAALTSYRFYTGFLSATWMPYLLAMEGRHLVEHRQSVFMGTAKLIYGMSILLNPIFGLLGDQLAVVSRWSGRRLFLIIGVGASGLGIYGCLVAAEIESVPWYLVGIVLWMLGEAMADITTETLVPELLPQSQYSISSSIRALNFLLGGLIGYACLIIFRSLHYSWLYYGYLAAMILCAMLTLCFIDAERPKPSVQSEEEGGLSLRALLVRAYLLPANYEGGFPLACLCLFVFSLGSAPMFFLLLMVRDVIGIKGQEELQTHFSAISIVFFVSAAAASIVGALAAHPAQSNRSAQEETDDQASARDAVDLLAESLESRNAIVRRWRMMVASTVLFGAVAATIPIVGLLPSLTFRTIAFYGVGSAFGLAFGSVYARFQECTWSILPVGVDVANAMGFAAMCKLAGVGLGNFGAGLVLDFYAQGPDAYRYSGYVSMCLLCSVVVLVSSYLAFMLYRLVLNRHDDKLARCALPDGCGQVTACGRDGANTIITK